MGLSSWLRDCGRDAEALALLRRAVEMGLPLLFRALWDIARAERPRGHSEHSLEIWRDLAHSRNAYRGRALIELAKHCERQENDYAGALDLTLQAPALCDSADSAESEARLRKRLAHT